MHKSRLLFILVIALLLFETRSSAQIGNKKADKNKDELTKKICAAFDLRTERTRRHSFDVAITSSGRSPDNAETKINVRANEKLNSVKIKILLKLETGNVTHEQNFNGRDSLQLQKLNFFSASSGKRIDDKMLFAQLNEERPFCHLAFGGSGFLFGVDEYTKANWADQLKESQIESVTDKKDGVKTISLVSSNKDKKWTLEFSKNADGSLTILKVSFDYKNIRRRGGDIISVNGEISNIKYDDKSGQLVSFQEVGNLHNPDREKPTPYKAVVKLNARKKIDEFNQELGDFEMDQIDDGERVIVVGQEDIKFEFRDGDIRKVVDER